MQYISTRTGAPILEFEDVVLTGLANDGGLYVPKVWPQISADNHILDMDDVDYVELAFEIIRPYIEDKCIEDIKLKCLIDDSYKPFKRPSVAPLVQIESNAWMLELFHGPTLAFKDFALQFLGRMFEHILTKRDKRLTIIGATSGDTGSAAIEACKGRDNLDIFMLHPLGRVSDVQRRQMTTVLDSNVHNIAIEGTFDDCQDLVKEMFNDALFRDDLNVSAVNSINWARVMAQIVYYFYAVSRLKKYDRPISFIVPTGNFGNVYAGYSAIQMGLNAANLVVASNHNDILTRFFETGDMSIMPVKPSLSPSMDIQVSSNFERLLFDFYDRDGEAVSNSIKMFREEGVLPGGNKIHSLASNIFSGYSTNDEGTLLAIKQLYDDRGVLVDPHTAVGLGALKQLKNNETLHVVLATAHPAKFPDAVKQATVINPDLPTFLSDLYDREERFTKLNNNLSAVESYIRDVMSSKIHC